MDESKLIKKEQVINRYCIDSVLNGSEVSKI